MESNLNPPDNTFDTMDLLTHGKTMFIRAVEVDGVRFSIGDQH
jgi:hypothetical protein